MILQSLDWHLPSCFEEGKKFVSKEVLLDRAKRATLNTAEREQYINVLECRDAKIQVKSSKELPSFFSQDVKEFDTASLRAFISLLNCEDEKFYLDASTFDQVSKLKHLTELLTLSEKTGRIDITEFIEDNLIAAPYLLEIQDRFELIQKFNLKRFEQANFYALIRTKIEDSKKAMVIEKKFNRSFQAPKKILMSKLFHLPNKSLPAASLDSFDFSLTAQIICDECFDLLKGLLESNSDRLTNLQLISVRLHGKLGEMILPAKVCILRFITTDPGNRIHSC